jgi:hypothetical protein
MKITIKFIDENAAFEDNGMNEYGHIMTQVYNRIYDQESGTFPLVDSNGNKVGTVEVRK